ncbi:glucosaminidase domain-containing protein [Flavobacteriaceae bacterium F89]|uniref:Peptidoglycan hydrolase n=1 Tax=Cerina litoralis TaxID=2874477 RepID=A0AAE3EU42_9FLAO|nr:glucosaminidase domain-containing protein [Cerina litoralis]MCG2459806.1 glucosaminidase domain-containing protein [Cerina litoralis]
MIYFLKKTEFSFERGILRVGTLFTLTLFLVGCGAKKRTAYTHNRTKQEAHVPSVSKNVHSETRMGVKEEERYPLPEDTGKFVAFPITSVEDYIETFAGIAQFEMKAYGIPASITLAQGILESGAGRSDLVRRTNNHFGIKCHTDWGGEYDFHDDDEKGECFRKYNHPMYSFRDHSIFLTSRARYAFLFDYKADDYKAWAKGLRTAGYATDRHYPQKLISFIERYKLYRYDEQVLNQGYVVERTPKTYDYKVHIVEKGDTLYSISRKYFVSVPELMKMNRLKGTTLSIGQELMVKSEKIN